MYGASVDLDSVNHTKSWDEQRTKERYTSINIKLNWLEASKKIPFTLEFLLYYLIS